MSGLVKKWLGPRFALLHPELQRLHEHGGRLQGVAELRLGTGAGAWLGRRLAHRLGLPVTQGVVGMDVEIREECGVLLWSRCFDLGGDRHRVTSQFRPVGRWPEGHWEETTGALSFRLTVDVVDGAWHWRVLGARLHGLPLPVRWLPRSHASKRIEKGAYRFEVAFVAPWAGLLLSYGGLLQLMPTEAPAGSPRPESGAGGSAA